MLSKNEDFFKTDHEKYKLDYASEKSNIVKNNIDLVLAQTQIKV